MPAVSPMNGGPTSNTPKTQKHHHAIPADRVKTPDVLASPLSML